MNLIDIVIIVVILIGFVLGYKDGFVRKLIGLIGFIAAIILAVAYSDNLGQIIESYLGIEIYLAQILAGVIIFLAVVFTFAVIKRIVHPFDKVNNFINQLLGGIIGIIQILFFISALLFILNIFNVPGEKSKKKSILYKKVYNLIPVTVDYLNNYTSKPKQIFQDFINDKDSI